jgi:hypothetical protein
MMAVPMALRSVPDFWGLTRSAVLDRLWWSILKLG